MAILVSLVISSLALMWSYSLLSIQTSFAEEQTKIFDQMRTKAFESKNLSEAVASLEYVLNYYPSGSKQQVGSNLDRIVERYRRLIENETVAHLRRMAVRDLGENPESWIREFGANR